MSSRGSCPLHVGFLLGFFNPEEENGMLRRYIPEDVQLLITTIARTSNPTYDIAWSASP
jgi:hypothetical protein